MTGATLLVDQDGALRFHGDGSSGAWLDHLLWNRSTGKLLPFFEPLSDALTKPAGSRTEWERRTLAAARWLAKALSSPWPSDSLISQMVALEAVFVPSSWRTKGKKIAEEVSARWVLPAKSRKEQEDWLVNLYRRRNETAHEGGSFEDEIEIDRLGDLTWKTVVWAASHLAPHHRVEWKPCETQAEAMGHDPI